MVKYRTGFKHQSKEQIKPAKTWSTSQGGPLGVPDHTSTDQHQHRPAVKQNMRWFVLVLVCAGSCWFRWWNQHRPAPAQTSTKTQHALVCAGAGAGLTAGLVLVFLAG